MKNLKEIALRIRKTNNSYMLSMSPEIAVDFAEALLAEIAKENEPVVIEEPDYHYEAMGCGLEDRGIQDRYEAMKHGWDCAIERFFEQLPDNLYPFPPSTEQIENRVAEACAELCDSLYITENAAYEIRAGKWKEYLK